MFDKCHRRIGAYWRLPIHELLEYTDPSIYSDGYVALCQDEVFVHHYQKKSDNRAQYINLLKQRIDDNPYDIEAMNHLTTEYMKNANWQAARDTQLQAYSRGLTCDCDWLECVCGNIANLLSSDDKYFDDVCMWYERAIKFNRKLRTYYLRYALYLCYGTSKSYPGLAEEVLQSMEAADTEPQDSFKEILGAWTWLPDDTWGVVESWNGRYETALEMFNTAYNKAVKAGEGESVLNNIKGHIDFARGKLTV